MEAPNVVIEPSFPSTLVTSTSPFIFPSLLPLGHAEDFLQMFLESFSSLAPLPRHLLNLNILLGYNCSGWTGFLPSLMLFNLYLPYLHLLRSLETDSVLLVAPCLQDKVQATYQGSFSIWPQPLFPFLSTSKIFAWFLASRHQLPWFYGNQWLIGLQYFAQAVPSCWNGLSPSLLCWENGCCVQGPAKIPSILQSLPHPSIPKAPVFLQHYINTYLEVITP